LLQRATGEDFRSKNILIDLSSADGFTRDVSDVLIIKLLIFLKICQAWKGPAVC
jgi:hypothetical protein